MQNFVFWLLEPFFCLFSNVYFNGQEKSKGFLNLKELTVHQVFKKKKF